MGVKFQIPSIIKFITEISYIYTVRLMCLSTIIIPIMPLPTSLLLCLILEYCTQLMITILHVIPGVFNVLRVLKIHFNHHRTLVFCQNIDVQSHVISWISSYFNIPKKLFISSKTYLICKESLPLLIFPFVHCPLSEQLLSLHIMVMASLME